MQQHVEPAEPVMEVRGHTERLHDVIELFACDMSSLRKAQGHPAAMYILFVAHTGTTLYASSLTMMGCTPASWHTARILQYGKTDVPCLNVPAHAGSRVF